ncbi:hypothetical protein [Corynebacterium pseudogenitalium]|uniref:Peptidase M10 metallopeptidase domain-containing protein n=1 Tax=Corynebacterium pseudogenitalium TaxID=38303 RepID=A0ABD4TSD4_9CORY|nr:hypothetical protein [Corynebacterium pseudogenitalium]MCQ4614678.1 hypothetical protein [Corynebacterium pseudogenitalium]
MKTRNVLAAVCTFSLVLGGTAPAYAHVDVQPNGSECKALKSQFKRGQQLDISRFTFPGAGETGIHNNTLYLYDTTGHRADIQRAADLWVKAVRDRGGYLDIKFIDHKTPEAVSVLVDPSLPVLGRVTGAGPSLTVRISPQMFASTVGATSRIMTIAHEMGHAMALAHSCDDLLMVSGRSRKPGLTPQPLDAEILILRNNLRQKPTPTPSPSPVPPLVTTTTSTTSERPKPTPTTSSTSSSSSPSSSPSQPSFPDLPPLPMPTIPSAQPVPTPTTQKTSTTTVVPTTSTTPTTPKPSPSPSPKPTPTTSTKRITLPSYVAPPKPSTEAEGQHIVDQAAAEFNAAGVELQNASDKVAEILAKNRLKNAERALKEAQDNLDKLREQLKPETPATTPTTSATPTTKASTTQTSTTSSTPFSSTTSTTAPVTTTTSTTPVSTTSAPRTTTSATPSVSATPTTSTTSATRTTPTVATSTSAETSTSSPRCCPNCGATPPQCDAPLYEPAVKPRSVQAARLALDAAKLDHKVAETRMNIMRRTNYPPLINDAQADLDRTFFRVNEAQENLDELLAKEPTPSSSTSLTTSPSSTTPTTSETPTSTSEEPSASASTSVSVEPSVESTTRTTETTSVAPSTTSVEPSTSVSVEVTTPTTTSTTSEPSAEPSTSEAPEPEPSAPRTTETTSAAPTTTSTEPSTSVSVEATTTEATTTTQSTTESATTTESAVRTTEQTSEPEVETSTSELTPEPSVGAPATCAKDGSSSGSSENCEGSSKGGIIAAIVVPLLALLGAAAFWAKDHLKF